MQSDAQLPGGTRALRPLLHLHKRQLTEYLSAIGQQHHTDQSNDDLDQMRNGIRALLAAQPELTQLLLKLHAASEIFRQMLLAATPEIRQPVTACLVADAPDLVARATSHRLLTAAGSPADELSRQVLQRLVTMCRDAATPPRQEFPGGIMVRRTKGQITTG